MLHSSNYEDYSRYVALLNGDKSSRTTSAADGNRLQQQTEPNKQSILRCSRMRYLILLAISAAAVALLYVLRGSPMKVEIKAQNLLPATLHNAIHFDEAGQTFSPNLYLKYSYDFRLFKQKFARVYSSASEEMYRFGIFMSNMIFIESHNALPDTPYTLGINGFGDLTLSEFQYIYAKGYTKKRQEFLQNRRVLLDPKSSIYDNLVVRKQQDASDIDWQQRGCVSEIKDQKKCGSCWAFSVSGAVEGAHCVKYGFLLDLTEQQLLDCSDQLGCDGGSIEDTFEWLRRSKGLCLEKSYPYIAEEEKCHICEPKAQILGYVSVRNRNPKALMEAVQRGPVSVAIEADKRQFQFYKSGVFGGKCGTKLNHAVLLVGYGTEQGQGDYWRVKNSWGPDWGDHGYVKLKRTDEEDHPGECGILLDSSYPIVK